MFCQTDKRNAFLNSLDACIFCHFWRKPSPLQVTLMLGVAVCQYLAEVPCLLILLGHSALPPDPQVLVLRAQGEVDLCQLLLAV